MPSYLFLGKVAIIIGLLMAVTWGVFALHDTMHYRQCAGQNTQALRGQISDYVRCLNSWP
jgi:hypothetical protein